MERNPTFGDMMVQLLLVLAALGLVVNLSLLVYQVYGYLRLGEWPHISVITALRWCNVSWAFSPTDWQGLYTMLARCPLPVVLVILGYLPFFLGYGVVRAEDNYRKKHR
jgi:hypothetical protein